MLPYNVLLWKIKLIMLCLLHRYCLYYFNWWWYVNQTNTMLYLWYYAYVYIIACYVGQLASLKKCFFCQNNEVGYTIYYKVPYMSARPHSCTMLENLYCATCGVSSFFFINQQSMWIVHIYCVNVHCTWCIWLVSYGMWMSLVMWYRFGCL